MLKCRYDQVNICIVRGVVSLFLVDVNLIYLNQYLQITQMTLDVSTILVSVRDVLHYFVSVRCSSGVLILEGNEGVIWKDHVSKCAPFHFPNVNDKINPNMVVIVQIRGLSTARSTAKAKCKVNLLTDALMALVPTPSAQIWSKCEHNSTKELNLVFLSPSVTTHDHLLMIA